MAFINRNRLNGNRFSNRESNLVQASMLKDISLKLCKFRCLLIEDNNYAAKSHGIHIGGNTEITGWIIWDLNSAEPQKVLTDITKAKGASRAFGGFIFPVCREVHWNHGKISLWMLYSWRNVAGGGSFKNHIGENVVTNIFWVFIYSFGVFPLIALRCDPCHVSKLNIYFLVWKLLTERLLVLNEVVLSEKRNCKVMIPLLHASGLWRLRYIKNSGSFPKL